MSGGGATGSRDFPTPAELLEQEARLQLPSCSDADALEIGRLLLDLADVRSLPVAIEVWRGGRLVFRAARPGTNAHNDLYLAGKRRVVEHFGHSSFHERLRHEAAGTTFEAATSLRFPEYAPHGGGFPLLVAGTGMVGVALVSGLPMQDDHALIVEALEAFLAGRAGRLRALVGSALRPGSQQVAAPGVSPPLLPPGAPRRTAGRRSAAAPDRC